MHTVTMCIYFCHWFTCSRTLITEKTCSRQISSCLHTHLSQQVTVEDLEHFIKAKLAQSLHGVADEGGSPALCQASDTILPYRHCKTVANAFVFIWVHLSRREATVRTRAAGISCFR